MYIKYQLGTQVPRRIGGATILSKKNHTAEDQHTTRAEKMDMVWFNKADTSYRCNYPVRSIILKCNHTTKLHV